MEILKDSERAPKKLKIRKNRGGKNREKRFIYRLLPPKFYVWKNG